MKTSHYMEDFSNPEIKCHIHLYNADYPELHDHDYWEFFIILSGEAEHYVGGQKQLLTSSIGCLVHPCDRHRFVNSSKSFQHLNIGITDKYFKQLLDFVDEKLYDLLSSINHPLIYEIDDSALNEIYKSIHSIQTIINQDIAKFANFLKLIWLDIIKLIYRTSSHLDITYPEWLNNFLQTLRQPENLVKPVSELCHLTYFSHRHLTRLFKQYTGKTLSSHVKELKMNYGAMLLRTTDMEILPISSACCYDSLSHFIKTFKSYFKMSPKKYRKSFIYAKNNNQQSE